MPADLHHPPGLARRGILAALGDLLDRRLAAQLLEQLLGDVAQLAHRLDHVDRDADGAGLVGDGAGDGLADPPGGVGAELVAAAVLVLVDRPHQAGVALLDEVQEATGRGCGTSWRSTRPAAGCRRRACAWPPRTRRRPAGSASSALAQRLGRPRAPATRRPGSSSFMASRSSAGDRRLLGLGGDALLAARSSCGRCASSFFISGWIRLVRSESSSSSLAILRRRWCMRG